MYSPTFLFSQVTTEMIQFSKWHFWGSLCTLHEKTRLREKGEAASHSLVSEPAFDWYQPSQWTFLSPSWTKWTPWSSPFIREIQHEKERCKDWCAHMGKTIVAISGESPQGSSGPFTVCGLLSSAQSSTLRNRLCQPKEITSISQRETGITIPRP